MSKADEEIIEEYKPTRTERALLEILLDPDNRFLPITKICEKAKIDRSQYYRAFKKPEFEDLYRDESRALVMRSIIPVVNACVNEALRGSAQHAKIVLGMAGEYSDKTDMRILDKNGEAQDVGGVVFYMPNNGREKEPEGE